MTTLTINRTAASIIGMILVVVLGVSTYAAGAAYRETHRNSATAAALKALVVRQNRQTQIVAHGQCLTTVDSRRLIRVFSGDQLTIVFNAQLPGTLRTPEEQALIDRTVAATVNRAAVVLHPIDCAKAAPLPKDLANAERAQLPAPEPIPPLHLPASPAVPVTTTPKGTP